MSNPTDMTVAKTAPKPTALGVMASRLSVEPVKLLETLKATVFKGATNEEMLALVVVANEYGLNPLLKEMYAFPAKGGGITPVVGIDGWVKIVNRQDNFDGVEFTWQHGEDGKPVACTCSIYVKGRSRPVIITEFFDECARNTEPWNKMPKRMLRHKALIQAARIAFGLSGVLDEDEARDVGVVIDVAPAAQPAQQQIAATSESPKAPQRNAQEELASVVIEAGYTFEAFSRWLDETGNSEPTFKAFTDLPPDLCKRLLRGRVAMLGALETMKGGVA